MKLSYLIIALCAIFFAPSGYADNYDNARKIIEMSKEVDAYQKSKLDGTYVDYSVTPTWVIVFWSVVGLGAVFVVGASIFSASPSKKKTDLTDYGVQNNLDGTIKTVDISELKHVIERMTVEEITLATGKTKRGIETILCRRGIKCIDFDGPAVLARIQKNTGT